MTPLSQSKVLRVLQDQRFERVGGHETIQTDVRIIAATHRDLDAMVADGQFRADLFYRLNGFAINLPALRERGEDIPLLVRHYLGRCSQELGKSVSEVSGDALKILRRYPWPGNVRQLQSVLRQAILRATGPILVPDFLPDEVQDPLTAAPAAQTNGATSLENFIDLQLRNGSRALYADSVTLLERMLLTRVLRHTSGNQSRAAKILGITRGCLRNKIRQLHITIDPVVTIEEDTSDEEPVTLGASDD